MESTKTKRVNTHPKPELSLGAALRFGLAPKTSKINIIRFTHLPIDFIFEADSSLGTLYLENFPSFYLIY